MSATWKALRLSFDFYNLFFFNSINLLRRKHSEPLDKFDTDQWSWPWGKYWLIGVNKFKFTSEFSKIIFQKWKGRSSRYFKSWHFFYIHFQTEQFRKTIVLLISGLFRNAQNPVCIMMNLTVWLLKRKTSWNYTEDNSDIILSLLSLFIMISTFSRT